MCMICDGVSRDEFLFDLDYKVTRYGWTITGVEAEPPDPGWLHTIGLTARGHPELVMVGAYPAAAAALNGLCLQVELGSRLGAGDDVELGGARLRVGEVHPAQVEQGLLNTWLEYHGAGDRPPPELRALQVWSVGCPCDACGVRLDTPAWVLGEAARNGPAPPPNRAVRRAARRARGPGYRPPGGPGFRPAAG